MDELERWKENLLRTMERYPYQAEYYQGGLLYKKEFWDNATYNDLMTAHYNIRADFYEGRKDLTDGEETIYYAALASLGAFDDDYPEEDYEDE